MSYYTKLSMLLPPPATPERTTALQGVTAVLDEIGVSHDIIKDLEKLFSSGKASVKVYPGHIDSVMTWVSQRQPNTRYVVKGQGEDQPAAWTHAYANGTKTVTKAPDKAKTKAMREAVAALERAGDGQPYSAKTRYVVGDAIVHPSFGKGVVLHAHPDKIAVQFLDGERTLIHAR